MNELKRECTTSNNFKFKVITAINPKWGDYDKSLAKCHLENYKVIFIDYQYEHPLDDEFEQEMAFEYYTEEMNNMNLQFDDVVVYSDFVITAMLDHYNEPILRIENIKGNLITRLNNSKRTIDLCLGGSEPSLIRTGNIDKAELKLNDVVVYSDITIAAKLDHNNEAILMAKAKEGNLIARPGGGSINLYSGQLYNTIDAYVESGDYVRCNNCDRQLLLPIGAEICPVCRAESRFSWLDDRKHQYDCDAIIAQKYNIKKCQLEVKNKPY